MTDTSGSGWLLAPMELSALVVGQGAGKDQGHYWSDLSPDFSKIWTDYAITGPSLVKVFPQGNSTPPPDGGVHLHWMLPEAFGHGVQNANGGLDYPYVPNRWLVRRVRYKARTADIMDVAAWMIESDFLQDIDKPKVAQGSVSFLHEKSKTLFVSAGRATPLQDWTEATTEYRLALTALGSGSPDFPSSYPACKSMLGFYDPAPGAGAVGDWDVSYQAIGWCSDPSHDLLAGVTDETLAQRLDDLGFDVSDAGQALGVMDRVLCHGASTRVRWNKDLQHMTTVPQSAATVYVGNSSAEALSAMLAQKMQDPGVNAAALEPILTAFHYDMLSSDQNLQDVGAELHRMRFTAHAGKDRYSIDARRDPVKAVTGDVSAPQSGEPPQPVQVLPEDIAKDLAALNQKAHDAALSKRTLDQTRQALFTLWAQWATQFTSSGTEPAALTAQINTARAAVNQAAQTADDAADAAEVAARALQSTLSDRLPDLTLNQSTAEPFYHAADPALVISGDGFAASNVYNKYSHADTLPCRHAGELIVGVSANLPNEITRFDVTAHQLLPLPGLVPNPKLATGPYPDLLDGVLRETLLLDPIDPHDVNAQPLMVPAIVTALFDQSGTRPSDLAVKNLTHAIQDLLNGTPPSPDDLHPASFDALTDQAPAVRPDPLGLARWLGNPWRPLYLSWEVEWTPQAGLDGTGDVSENWNSWKLNDSGDEFAVPSPLNLASKTQKYSSYTMLAPNAGWVLRRRLEQLIDRKANERLSEIVSQIDNLPALAQSLSGFQEALGQLAPGLQLPPIDPNYLLNSTGAKADAVSDDIDGIPALDQQYMHAPLLTDYGKPSTDFQPIRAGLLTFKRLAVVDSFGQTRSLLGADSQTIDLVSSFGLQDTPADLAHDSVVLPPRYLQPARVDARWVSADPEKEAGSPLCGWVFPNHLDQSLMVCDAGGHLLGAVQTIIRVPGAGEDGTLAAPANPAFFWVPVPGSDTLAQDIADPELNRFVSALLAYDADTGRKFLAVIQTAQDTTGATVEHDARLSILIGRPLALVRAALRLELDGAPYRDIATPLPDAGDETGDADRGVAKVSFPVWMGGRSNTAGGLAGFLLEGDATFYPRFGLSGTKSKEIPLDASTPVLVTLLMDPHAAVHVRSGVLPRHSFSLPGSVITGLARIRDVFFQSAPLVGPAGGPRVPSPSDDYGQWSWAVRPQVTKWVEYADITDPGNGGGFGTAPQEIQEGWLKLTMNPVSIGAFWVKEGAVKVDVGTRITLGWTAEGADRLVLALEGQESPLAVFDKSEATSLPTEFKYQVDVSGKVTLTASDKSGNRSIKSLDLSAN